MSEFPPAWQRAALADIAEVRLGRQRSPKRATGDRMRPYLRAANVTWRGLQVADVKEMDFTEQESATYELRVGDLLLAEASGSPGEVGKPAQFKGEIEGCCFQNTLLRVRLPEGLSPDFYEHFFREQALNGRFAAGSRGVGIRHLGAAALSEWQVPIPPSAEQERIVAAIDEAFSKLDAGEAGLRMVRQLLKRLRDAILTAAVTGRITPQDPTDTPAAKILADLGVEPIEARGLPDLASGWAWTTVADAGRVDVGRMRHPDWHNGPNMKPYLRVANVFEARIDTDDVDEMHFEPAVYERYRLSPGDVLLNEGQTPALLGRPAIFRGVPEGAAFTKSLLRFRPHAGVLSEWALVVFRHFMRSGRFTRESRITTNIAHLPAIRLKPIEFPLPPLEEQVRIVAEVDRQMSFVEACERAVDAGLARSAALRRSVLKAAFEGRLVPHDPTDEPTSVLLERIRAEREATPKSKRSRAGAKA